MTASTVLAQLAMLTHCKIGECTMFALHCSICRSRMMWRRGSIYGHFGHFSMHMRRNSIISSSCRNSVVIVVLSVIELRQKYRNFDDLTMLWLIFGHIFTAHAQKGPFPSFRLKFRWLRWIVRSQCLIRNCLVHTVTLTIDLLTLNGWSWVIEVFTKMSGNYLTTQKWQTFGQWN